MNLPKLLRLKGEFRATHGVEATHVFVGGYYADNLSSDNRPYGLIPVELDATAGVELAVGIIFPTARHDKP
jgi:hypothetical protein